MTVKCPNCEWSAEIPDEKIPAGGGKGTCPKCQIKFEVHKDANPLTEEPLRFSTPIQRDTKACPLCGEEILSVAKKCKHCQSMIDDEPTNNIEKKADEDRVLKEKLSQIEQNVAAAKSKYNSIKGSENEKRAEVWFASSGEKQENQVRNSSDNSFKVIKTTLTVILTLAVVAILGRIFVYYASGEAALSDAINNATESENRARELKYLYDKLK